MQVQLDCWAIGSLAHPYVQVLALARFEVEDVVAIVEVCQLIELVKLCFGVEFCIFAAVRKECVEIVEEMSMSFFFWNMLALAELCGTVYVYL